jgi:chromosome segregation ATPase
LTFSWNNIIGEYENFISEKEKFALSILTAICEDVKIFQKKMKSLNDKTEKNDFSSPNINESIESLKSLKTKAAVHQEEIQNFQKNLLTIEDFGKKMKSILCKSSAKINTVFANYHLIKKSLLEIMEKLEKYSYGLVTLEKDFSYLSNPSSFPQAYYASIIEIKRRIIFNKRLMKEFDRLKQLINKENVNRKQFIQDYGKFLTHDYIPQLKFTDLKVTIDYYNNDEITNIPYLLEEDEESTINDSNIYLDYEEVSGIINNDNGIFKRNNRDIQVGMSQNSNINVNLSSNKISTRKNSEERKSTEYEENIRVLNSKLSELEMINNIKEGEIKKLLNKLEQKERKVTSLQTDIEKLGSTIDSISENFLRQISYKDQKLKEKILENENMIKVINLNNGNKLDNCLMCRDSVLNSIDYQSWGTFVKEYHEKIIDKNKTLSKIESKYNELVAQTSFIKKTFFNHLHSVIETKNLEIMNIKANYENKLMHVEDLLSTERMKITKSLNTINSEKSLLEEEIKIKKSENVGLENKIKDLNKFLNNSENEFKKVKIEKDQLKKQIDEQKLKENNYFIDLKAKETKCDSLILDLNKIEKQCDMQKKNINQLSDEIIMKVKENSNFKHSLDIKEKIIEELEKALESSKINHIETLNEVHKANKTTIEKLNEKIDEMTQVVGEKFSSIEDLRNTNRELKNSLEEKIEELKNLREKISLLDAENQKLKKLLDERENDSINYKQNNETLLKKIEEYQVMLVEKEKKLNVKKLGLLYFKLLIFKFRSQMTSQNYFQQLIFLLI